MTEASLYLLGMAKRLAEPYAAFHTARAVMATGSAALGVSDFYSDLDMTVYYEELPSEDDLRAAMIHNGASERLWLLGNRGEGALAEAYLINGVECQIGHTTIAAWERDMAAVMEGPDPVTPMQKALSGTLDCVPLYGAELIQTWKVRIAEYPEPLAQAMVEKHLSVFPLWRLQNRLETRDAVCWHYQILVEAVQNILGVMAGLNRLYFSTFQFKRMGEFIGEMRLAPPDLARRLDSLFILSAEEAALRLEELVAETIVLVERQMPQVATASEKRRLGARSQPWAPAAEEKN